MMTHSMTWSRRSIGFAALALTFGSATMARGADASLIEAAKKEGEVVWYTTMIVDQVVRPMADAWAKKYPDIKLRFSRAPSVEQSLKITNEARVGRLQADVFDGSTTIFALLDANLVEPYKPEAAADFPADFRDANGVWTALNAYFLVPAFNNGQPPDPTPKTLDDLLDPKLRGKMAWPSDESIDGPAGFVAMALAVKGEERGMDYLRKLGQQKIATAAPGQRVTLDKVIVGEYPLGLMMYLHQIDFSRMQGAPVDWIRMEPAWATRNYVGLIKGAPHPNGGKLLLEFLLSEDGQKVLRDAGYIPVHPKVPPSNPDLRPDKGQFKYLTATMDDIRRKLPDWQRIHRELLR